MKVTFYNTTSDSRKVNKSLTALGSAVDFELKEDSSIINPVLILNKNSFISKSNYLYIKELDRYYFINDIKYLTGNRIEIYSSLDVLYTYKDELLKCNCLIDRTKTVSDKYIIDSEIRLTSKPITETYSFGKSFDNNLHNVLIVCG